MQRSAIEVSVLVPARMEAALIGETVRAMLAQRLEGAFEIIVIEGRSTDGTREILEAIAAEDGRLRILDNPTEQTTSALNIGLRAAEGEFVARMDAHTHYPADYLAHGVARLRRGDVSHVSGPAIADGPSKWSRRVALALSTKLGTGGATFRQATGREVEVDSGFAGIWRRTTLQELGGWDEGWPQNQDAELAARLHAAGGRSVCIPEMTARYVPRDNLQALARQYWRYGSYRAKTSRRHPDSMRRSHVLAPGMAVCMLLILLPGRAGRPARIGFLLYGISLVGASAGTLNRARPADAATLPLILSLMHFAWGLGFLAGCARFGPPVAALRRLISPNR
jgi:succinoglycan biosynthesis protein ExoA